jgi:amidase
VTGITFYAYFLSFPRRPHANPSAMTTREDINAFISHDDVQIEGAAGGPLSGLTFAAKDIFDIAGHVTGCGNPAWLASHRPAAHTSPAVTALLQAGADLVGKTHTNELAFSVTGENAHYGTPVNVNAPGRVPGGSSSGSAAAVAAGLCDLALGSDTGGSVRIPASFCGVYGLRPTHGRIPLDHVMPLAPSFDTVGWFTRDGGLLARAGEVLLPGYRAPEALPPLLIAADAFEFCGAAVSDALAPALDRIRGLLGAGAEVRLSEEGPAHWLHTFRILQGHEVWRSHGEWVSSHDPQFGPGVRERFDASAQITDAEAGEADAARQVLRTRIHGLLTDGAVVCLPTAPCIAPKCGAPEPEMDAVRQRVISLTSQAGLSGCPQVTLPLGTLDGCPLGISLMAAPGGDEVLLDLAARLAA